MSLIQLIMKKRNISGKSLNNVITSDDILGKEIIDREGSLIGVAEKVLIDSVDLDFIGIEVDKGFLKKGLSIGRSYIDRVTENAIFLKIRVVYEIKGMTVFDNVGAKVGIVSGIELFGEKNKIKNIYIKKGLARKEIVISAELVETMGENIILNVSKQELMVIKKDV